MGNSTNTDNAGTEPSTKLGAKRPVIANSAAALLESLLVSAEKSEASSIHIYSTGKAKSCYFEMAGKLAPTGKKFSDKVLEELVEYVKASANLEKSELAQAQTAQLHLSGKGALSLTFLISPEFKTYHLILSLEVASKPKDFEGLGFWGKSLEHLEAVLDSKKGIIIVDSLDQYSLRSLINSCLGYIKQGQRVTSVSFDSSLIPSPKLQNHDRIFIKINKDTIALAKKALATNLSAVVFLDPVSPDALELAIEQSQRGSLVFLTTSEGSVARSLKSVQSISSSLNQLLEQLKVIVSISPIQTIASSNGSHPLDTETISKIENFFGLDLPDSWRDIYGHAGIKTPEELLHLIFPLASEYAGLTNLVEVLRFGEDIKRPLLKNPALTSVALNAVAIRSGMLTKKEDGLIKALRKEVDLADVIETCR